MISGTGMQDVISVQTGSTSNNKITDNNQQHKKFQVEKPGSEITQNKSNNSSLGFEKVSDGVTVAKQKTQFHAKPDGQIVYERYDDNGNLIQMIPPGYVPISEKA